MRDIGGAPAERNPGCRVFGLRHTTQHHWYHASVMHEPDLACRDCGATFGGCRDLPRRGVRRCGAVFSCAPAARIADPRALAAAAIILLLLANIFPVFDVSLLGDHRSRLIAGGAAALFGYGGAFAAVGALVALVAVAIPALDTAATLGVLLYLGTDGGGLRHIPRWVGRIWRAAIRLHPWSMLDVFLLAAVVAYSRLGEIARITIGTGGYALAAFVAVRMVLDRVPDSRCIWQGIDDPAKYPEAAGAPRVPRLDGDLVVAAHAETGGERRRYPHCGAPLASRPSAGLAITALLTIAGLVLYLPANLLPVLSITSFGFTVSYTIIGGVRELARAGLWPLALLVFTASILVPALKLATLLWCLVAIPLRSARLLRQRTALHRFVASIGRWSMIDVFVVAMVVATVQFGFFAAVAPGPGIACFAAVVVLTMIAAGAFDPRLMWDAAKGAGGSSPGRSTHHSTPNHLPGER